MPLSALLNQLIQLQDVAILVELQCLHQLLVKLAMRLGLEPNERRALNAFQTRYKQRYQQDAPLNPRMVEARIRSYIVEHRSMKGYSRQMDALFLWAANPAAI